MTNTFTRVKHFLLRDKLSLDINTLGKNTITRDKHFHWGQTLSVDIIHYLAPGTNSITRDKHFFCGFYRFWVFFRAGSLQNEVGDPPFFFTFLTSLTHHLSMIKFPRKNQCWKNLARPSLSQLKEQKPY